MPSKFGIILGDKERVEFRVEDFFHYYLRVKSSFLAMNDGFTGNLADCPEPQPRAEHRRWTSHAEAFFTTTDHLVQVAGITVGQIKKLKAADVKTVAELANASGIKIHKLPDDSLKKLVAQARLQCATRADRAEQPDAPPRFEILPFTGPNGEPLGLAALPPDHPADVFFDMEGYAPEPNGIAIAKVTAKGQEAIKKVMLVQPKRESFVLAIDGITRQPLAVRREPINDDGDMFTLLGFFQSHRLRNVDERGVSCGYLRRPK